MVTLTVDRLHARYAVDRPATAARLDDCLRRVVDGELDAALAGVALPAGGHVCVPRLTVRVRLDSAGVAAARSWAAEIASALERAVAGRTDGVVVYPRTLDALVDLLVSAGRGDLRRAWAWRQVGLLPAGSDVAANPLAAGPLAADPLATRPLAAGSLAAGPLAALALGARPELACAALVAAAALGPVPLTAAGWVAVARAVDELVPPVRPGDAGPDVAGAPDTGHAPDRPDVPHIQRTRWLPKVLDAPVARRLPPGVAGLPPPDRYAVAGLLLLCAAPALARSAPARAAVARALAGSTTAPEPAAAAPDAAAGPARTAVHSAVLGVVDAAGSPGPPPPAARSSTSDGEAAAETVRRNPDAPGSRTLVTGPPGDRFTPAGGVLFLLAFATGLDLPEALDRLPFPTVLGWLAAHLGDVPADDPAVHVLSGQPPRPPDPPGPAQRAGLHLLAGQVRDRLRPALAAEPDDDLGWLWRRPARITAEPGWVEATYALADVDTRVRSAGLDLDPGFVWWLGAVVRYRYA